MMMLCISLQNNNNNNYCDFICKGKRRDTSKLHSVINNQPCSDAEEQTPKTRPSSNLPRLATLVSVMPRLLHSLTQAMAEKLAQFLAQNSTQLKSSAIASRCEAQLTPIYDEVARNIFLTATDVVYNHSSTHILCSDRKRLTCSQVYYIRSCVCDLYEISSTYM